jgi:di/tricarboxylate transporter
MSTTTTTTTTPPYLPSSLLSMVEAATTSSSKQCVPYNWTAANQNLVVNWQGYFVLADIFVLFITLYFDIAPIEFAMVGCVLILAAAQIITVPQLTEGFSNSGILSVACLFIVAEALASTGAIDYFMGKILGKPKTLSSALLRLMIPSAFIAAWISSTAVLALLIPVVLRWAKTIDRPPSQLMMPLCYAIHLGGTCTLVGTTTNLVISGLAQQYYCNTMNIFYLTRVGLPVAIFGIGVLLTLTPLTLPNAKEYVRRTTAKSSQKKKNQRRRRLSSGGGGGGSSISSTSTSFVSKMKNFCFGCKTCTCLDHVGCSICCGKSAENTNNSHNASDDVLPTTANGSFGGSILRNSIRTNTNNNNTNGATGETSNINNNNNGDEEEFTIVKVSKKDEVEMKDDDFILMGRIPPHSPVANQTVEDAGLRHLGGLFLFSVQRGKILFHAVSPTFMLQEGDVLNFAGGGDENFIEFCEQRGLIPVIAEEEEEEDDAPLKKTTSSSAAALLANNNNYTPGTIMTTTTTATTTTTTTADPIQQPQPQQNQNQNHDTSSPTSTMDNNSITTPSLQPSPSITPNPVLTTTAHDPVSRFTAQAIVRSGSALIGQTPKDMKFRSTYKASIISISRAGERLEAEKLGKVVLKIGDILLLVTSAEFSWDDPVTKRDLKPRVDGRQVKFILAQKESVMMDVNESNVALSENLGKRDYLFGMRVSASAAITGVKSLAGSTLEKSGLRNISGLRVVALEHDGKVERAVGPDAILQVGDIVWCIGERESLASLRRIPGLEDLDSKQVERLQVPIQHRRLVEVVISLQSDILYKTVRESRFRTRFDAAIVAIQRQGTRLISKIGDIVLEPGDVLILDTGPDFLKRFKDDSNFLIVSEVDSSTPPRFDRFYLAVTAALAMVIVTAAAGIDLLICALFAVGIMLAFGVTTRERAHAAVDWKIIITVASAFGLSAAMVNTNIGTVIGTGITDWAVSTGTGQLGVLLIIMIMTEIICALITAKAGALLMFPIAAAAAAKLSIPPENMLIALMMGSSDYTTPQGHQTNLMVMGPGAYRFTDYQKLGIPLEVFLNAWQILSLALIADWWISVLLSIGALLLLILIDRFSKGGERWIYMKDWICEHVFGYCCCNNKCSKNQQHQFSDQQQHTSYYRMSGTSSSLGGGGAGRGSDSIGRRSDLSSTPGSHINNNIATTTTTTGNRNEREMNMV